MTGPKYILRGAETEKSPERRLGQLTGLLMLGDRRTLPLLEHAWGFLDDDEREEWCYAHSGVVSAVLVEFLLSRLEELDDEEDGALFGAVAGALARLPSDADQPVVQDLDRKFPVNADDDRPEIRVVREWSMEEYGRVIAPRLYMVMEREHEPKAVPTILREWGIPLPKMQDADEEDTDVIEITLTPRSAGIPSDGKSAKGMDDDGYSTGGMSLEDIAAEREKGWWLDLQDEYLNGSPMDETEVSVARREQMVHDAMADVEQAAEARGLTIQFEHAITGLLFSVKSIYVMPSNEEYDRITQFAKELASAFEFNQYTRLFLVS